MSGPYPACPPLSHRRCATTHASWGVDATRTRVKARVAAQHAIDATRERKTQTIYLVTDDSDDSFFGGHAWNMTMDATTARMPLRNVVDIRASRLSAAVNTALGPPAETDEDRMALVERAVAAPPPTREGSKKFLDEVFDK